MDIGELRHRIIFQKQVIEVNENGFEEVSWENYKTVWASVSNLSGREYFQAAAIQKENTVKFKIRYIDLLDTSMQIVFNEKSYNIISIDNVKYENRYIEIKAFGADKNGED
ncbi:MAG: phage head closure protein [Clostridiales bacterium]|nr:phage head closure protein [Clostridiales bacterium]